MSDSERNGADPQPAETSERVGSDGLTPAQRTMSQRAAKERTESENTPQARERRATKAAQVGNPTWWVPVMCALMIFGVLWISTFYITEGNWPIGAIGYWNLGIGLVTIMAGFGMTMNWK